MSDSHSPIAFVRANSLATIIAAAKQSLTASNPLEFQLAPHRHTEGQHERTDRDDF
ncbi:MAG: hypothetical protein KME42_04210 [Tildeniella nuda ZEHNDER 1965/U140]|nr:hypothetical protein [Tildeniella nuda ZEHNDER 1965/U140]